MRVFAYREWIDGVPDAVFDVLVDFTRAPQWRHLVRSVEPVAGGALGVGTRLRVLFDAGGSRYERELEIVAYDPPRRYRHRSVADGLRFEFEYQLAPERGGTRLVMACHASPVTAFGVLALPVLLLRRHDPYRQQLARLKRLVESETR